MRHRMSLFSLGAVFAYGLFIEVLWGWKTLWQAWEKIGLGPVAGAMALLISSHLVRCLRIHDYFVDEMRGHFLALFRVTQVHNLLNIVLPFRTGEASFPLLMRMQFGIPLARSTAALVWMRVLDLHALLAAGGFGLVLLSSYRLPALLVLLAFCLLPLAGLFLQKPLGRLISRHAPAKFASVTSATIAGLPADRAAFLRAWFMTALNWSVKVLAIAWILQLLGVSSWAPALGGAVGGELSSVLPFHAPAGVGTYPAGITAGALALDAGRMRQDLELLAKASVNVHILILVSALLGTAASMMLAPRAGRHPPADM